MRQNMINYSPVIKMKQQMKGTLALLLGTFVWGMAFIAQSVGMELIGPFTFQAIRCLLGVLFLFPASLLLDCKIGMAASLKKWKSKKLWRGGIICGAALFAATSLQQVGLVYTAPGKAGFLTAMYIVLVPILGIFVHRRPGLNAVFSVLLALVGLYLLSFTDISGINIGDLLMIACALAFAAAGVLAGATGQRQCAQLCRLYFEGARLCGSMLVLYFFMIFLSTALLLLAGNGGLG